MTIKTTGDKMKRSIRRKIISTVVLCFLVLTALLVSASIFSISDVSDDDPSGILRLKCSKSVQQTDEELSADIADGKAGCMRTKSKKIRVEFTA